MRTLALILGTAAALSGCAHRQTTAIPRPTPALRDPLLRVASHNPAKVAGVRATPRAPGADDAVYFNFDSSLLRAEDLDELRDMAQQLLGEPQRALRIEGNCDERGTDEYNLALGEQRAQAAKRYLVRLGIAPSRISTLSYGKERPKYFGHEEAARSKNRRDDFVLLLQ